MSKLKISSLKQQMLLAVSLSLVSVVFTVPSYADSVVLTFSTVGDSRQDPQAPDSTTLTTDMKGNGNCQVPAGATGLVSNPGLSGQDCKWLQNTAAWSLLMRTIQAQKANLLFFNGDMIMGYGKADVPVTRTSNGVSENPIATPSISDILNSDVMQSYKQYAFWRGMVANLMETGTYVVPVPGNHEVQCKRCGKSAQKVNEDAWRDNMGDLILDTSRFNTLLSKPLLGSSVVFDKANAPGVNDGITTDQSQLSYSFNVGKNHFVVINTDAVGADGHAPTKWLENDFITAESKGATHHFVFGHKPAFYYVYNGAADSSTNSLNGKDPVAATAFWDVINKYKATYFCGHEHEYNVSQPLGGAKSSYQVLVGTGGSPFDAIVPGTVVSSTVTAPALKAPSDRMYSWATVQIYSSGKVVMNTYGFDDTLKNPVKKLATITLAAK